MSCGTRPVPTPFGLGREINWDWRERGKSRPAAVVEQLSIFGFEQIGEERISAVTSAAGADGLARRADCEMVGL